MTNTGTKQIIIDDISRRAPLYAPEWRFHPESPDAGVAFALLWADMFEGTLERFAQLPDNYRRALLDAIGSDPIPAVRARGWLAFNLRDDADDTIIPEGTIVYTSSDPDLALATDRELAASPAKVTNIFCIIPERDVVFRYDGLADLELFRAPADAKHVLTFRHPFAFNVSEEATLRLVPQFDGGDLEVLAVLPWEYLDDDDWRDLLVTRDGDALHFAFPTDKTSYCEELRVTANAETADNLILLSLTALPSGLGLFPDALYSGDAQADEVFYPFGQRFMPGNRAYFACLDALMKPGAKTELSFTLNYDDFEIEGYSEREMRMRTLMRVSEFEEPERFEITASEIKWEYWNGTGWAVLNVQNGTEIFNGKTTGRVRLVFDCPKNLRSTIVGAHDLPFICARIISADNLYRQHGYYRAPRVSDVSFSYRYSDGVTVTDVLVTEHLNEREAYFPLKLAEKPDGPAALYFAFDRKITQGVILFNIAPEAQPPAMRWEYLTVSGWLPLNVRDNTAGLRKIGILSYETTESPASAQIWGTEAYWIRIACEGRTYTGNITRRPLLRGLYENTIRATAITPGEASRLPARAFTTMTIPLPGVTGAYNPVATYGGADIETEDKTIARLTVALSHLGRAVSAGDIEALAREASPRVMWARCYEHTNEHGRTAYGESALVLLPSDAEDANFDVLRDEVKAYIEDKRALGAGPLHIIAPRYIAVNVFVITAIKNPDEALSVKYRINTAMAKLLTPTNWPIGSLPTPGQIDTVLRAVSGVLYLVKTEVSYIWRGIASDYAKAISEAFILPVNGKHEITFEN